MACRVSSPLHGGLQPLSREYGSVNSSSAGGTSKLVPHARFRLFKRKGAILVLLWSFCGLFAFNFVASASGQNGEQSLLSLITHHISPLTVFVMCALFYPILGWLADVHYGRYKVIKWSLRMMWVSLVLFCLASVVLTNMHLAKKKLELARSILGLVVYGLISLGLGGFQANILQFGIDQLVDAASCEITSFLRWYAWLWFLNGVFQAVSQSCLCPGYEVLGNLLLPALMTVAVALDSIFNHWLVKEPASENPFVWIYRILRYAAKNKYPRLRSAFTYWEDKPYSRIDLAKDRYGGPFTTEQVEDVKTFFRIIRIVTCGAFFVGMFIAIYPAYDRVWLHLTDRNFVNYSDASCGYPYVRDCLQRVTLHYTGHCIMIVVVPLFEFVLYPLLTRCFEVFILKKVGMGMAALALGCVACTAIEFVANEDKSASVTTCILNGNPQYNSLPLDYRWMVIAFTLNSIGQFLVLTAVGEFLCAQSPYSLKGFLFGFVYGCAGFFAIVGYGVMLSVAATARKWMSGGFGCMSWYLLMAMALLLVILGVFIVVVKCYKKRMRLDSEHNEQIFAVNYYSQGCESTK